MALIKMQATLCLLVLSLVGTSGFRFDWQPSSHQELDVKSSLIMSTTTLCRQSSYIRHTFGQRRKFWGKRIIYYLSHLANFQVELFLDGDVELNPGPSSYHEENPDSDRLYLELL